MAGTSRQSVDSEMNSVISANTDSDSDDGYFFSKSNQIKVPYTLEEDEAILEYVLRGQNIFRTTSISLWKCLEAKKENPKRSYQSLKNRFLRNIKPKLLTAYRYMIKDEDSLKKVLNKFPELKKTKNIKGSYKKLNLPLRQQLSDSAEGEGSILSSTLFHGATNITIVKEEISSPPKLNEDIEIDEVDECILRKNHESLTVMREPILAITKNRNVKIVDEKVLVTISNDGGNNKTFKKGIYQKFLELKNKNKMSSCEYCGRCYPDVKKENDKELTIVSSYETNFEQIPKDSDVANMKKKSLPKNTRSTSSSSSLTLSLDKDDWASEDEKDEKENSKRKTDNSNKTTPNQHTYKLRSSSNDASSKETINPLHGSTVKQNWKPLYSESENSDCEYDVEGKNKISSAQLNDLTESVAGINNRNADSKKNREPTNRRIETNEYKQIELVNGCAKSMLLRNMLNILVNFSDQFV